jgi:hypothetical protein
MDKGHFVAFQEPASVPTPKEKDCASHLPHVLIQRVLVLLPEVWDLCISRELLAAHLHGDLKAVARQVVEILHAWGSKQ